VAIEATVSGRRGEALQITGFYCIQYMQVMFEGSEHIEGDGKSLCITNTSESEPWNHRDAYLEMLSERLLQ